MTILRSALYMPGINQKAMDKALNLDCDAVVLDLEDAVEVSKKEDSRQLVIRQIENNDYGPRVVVVRVNDLGTKWGEQDVAAVANLPIQAILVPKVSEIRDISRVVDLLNRLGSELPIWIMVETPLAIININELARQPRVTALVMGTSDLVVDLCAEHLEERQNISYALQRSIIAARAFGKKILDGVHLDFRDLDSLRNVCRLGKSMGFDGKTLIHPDQIPVANDAFSPSEAELDKAKRVIDAWRSAQTRGSGVVEVDGTLVESLHVEEAKRLISFFSEISERA
jgi:citrate lyase subunit beta/citryl-CoA lyase|tara:strand:+ start:1154 stop:2005 length:852 start_codon:yes stop_codon:yes gene_type:complete